MSANGRATADSDLATPTRQHRNNLRVASGLDSSPRKGSSRGGSGGGGSSVVRRLFATPIRTPVHTLPIRELGTGDASSRQSGDVERTAPQHGDTTAGMVGATTTADDNGTGSMVQAVGTGSVRKSSSNYGDVEIEEEAKTDDVVDTADSIEEMKAIQDTTAGREANVRGIGDEYQL